MASTLKGKKAERRCSELILEIYSNLLLEIWEVVSALIGEAILTLLFTLSIRKLGEKVPFLSSLKVSEEGISFNGVEKACETITPGEIHRGFQSLINHLSHLFSALADGVINKELFPKIFPKIREAERMVSQSGSR